MPYLHKHTFNDLENRFAPDIIRTLRPLAPLRLFKDGSRYALARTVNGEIKQELASAVAPQVDIAAWLIAETLRRDYNLPEAPRQPRMDYLFEYPNLGKLPGTVRDAIGDRALKLTVRGDKRTRKEAKGRPYRDCGLFTLSERETAIALVWAPCRSVALWLMMDRLMDHLSSTKTNFDWD
jgi:hypothetical protein